MRTTACFCGVEISGADLDEQAAAGQAHFREAHPDIPVTREGMCNFLEREEMLTGSTERLEAIGEVSIVDLSPEHIDDVMHFFDREAFADNPGWAACYCMCHHVFDAEWAGRGWRENRADLAERLAAGTTTGTLAYVDGKLAGWCNSSPLSAYPSYAKNRPESAGNAVGVVACFVIAPPYRGHGLAKALLDRALGQFEERGIRVVEGYCATNADNPAVAYRGTIPLYESAGFVVATADDRTTTMRKEL